ncbi:hypothetical protein [Nocardia abscessus]|uniref:hypothetical protein n=1 Tax=Nocardia abscessus TaxID=120957 RepID=UPI0002DD9037|nr:hypothetical protein [Nocardia abscessus]MCC3326834.1 hypothetical protein [Nocardia abscessus]
MSESTARGAEHHPTHSHLTPEERLAPGPVRLAVGIEDIPADLRAGFAAATT